MKFTIKCIVNSATNMEIYHVFFEYLSYWFPRATKISFLNLVTPIFKIILILNGGCFMKIFISGGCKNGKSYFAQKIAKIQNKKKLYYVATMNPSDSEDLQRIQKHRQERDGWGFETIEQPKNISNALLSLDSESSILLDSLTALLANEMFSKNEIKLDAASKICNEIKLVCSKINNIVFVSDYIYSDAFLYDALTEDYRKSLSQIDRTAAKCCDVVIEVVYGNIVFHKGAKEFESIYGKIC